VVEVQPWAVWADSWLPCVDINTQHLAVCLVCFQTAQRGALHSIPDWPFKRVIQENAVFAHQWHMASARCSPVAVRLCPLFQRLRRLVIPSAYAAHITVWGYEYAQHCVGARSC